MGAQSRFWPVARAVLLLAVLSGVHLTVAKELDRYPAKGFALDCLSNGIPKDRHTGLPGHVSWGGVKSLNFQCPGNRAHLYGRVLAATLFLGHLPLLILPLAYVYRLASRQKHLRNLSTVKDLGWLLVGIALFSVAVVGELSQHIHDNWLFINYLPTFYTVLFFGGVAASQAAMVVGLRGWEDKISKACVGVAVSSGMICSTLAMSDTVASTPLFGPAGAVTAMWIAGYAPLAVIGAVFLKTLHERDPADKQDKSKWLVAVGGSYALAVLFALASAKTGTQFWHLMQGPWFMWGFWNQMKWLEAVLQGGTMTGGVKQQAPDAHVDAHVTSAKPEALKVE